jgi:hypothetical protein
MATPEEVAALRSRLREALGSFSEGEIRALLHAEQEQRVLSAESVMLGTTSLPSLAPADWAALRAYLIADDGPPLDASRGLSIAYHALMRDSQAQFWLWVLASLRGFYRRHPEVVRERLLARGPERPRA